MSQARKIDSDEILKTFLINSPDMIFIKDNEKRYLAASQAFCDLVRIKSSEDVRGKTDFDLFSEELALRYVSDDEGVLAGKPMLAKKEPLPALNGRKRYSSTNKFPIFDDFGNVVGLYGVGRDITLQEELKIEVASAQAVKTDFLARMSHDMRTPLNGIVGLVSISLEEDDVSVLKENLKKIDTVTKYLAAVINDTLVMSKINSNRIKLDSVVFDSKALLDDVLLTIKPLLEAKHIVFNVKTSGTNLLLIKGDPVRLQQIVTNVLSNAAKFTPDGGQIDLTVECVSKTQKFIRVKISVKDSGIGMSPDYLPHIFEPFSQEGNTLTKADAGTGLGMSIVKNLVELMDGEINVESELGKGTTVVIYLTFGRVSQTVAPLKAVKDYSRLCGKRVLLCEDNQLNSVIAQRLLESKGCVVDCAFDGQQAVDVFSTSPENTYFALLMDLKMPVVDGLEATRKIRALKRADSGVPIVAMTANAFEEDAKLCKAAGMTSYVSKPFEPKQLFDILADLVR